MKHSTDSNGLYIMLISVHGLIRADDLELGRDADTGGQTKYVVELARALAAHPQVDQVDLLTRQVIDKKVGPDYAQETEDICPGARIVRIQCGPRRYLRKEVLWPHLRSFADHALHHIKSVGRVPDVIHSHYADAGFVGIQLSGLLGVPFVFTGHSLGREKQRRLRDRGIKESSIESQYRIGMRIEAEEMSLETAAMVVASTQQEIDEQYSIYDDYQPERMRVIPPGVDLERFHPPKRGWHEPKIKHEINRFLNDPSKPLILALSRADERKNITSLVRAYGENPRLRSLANLAIIAGNRDTIAQLDKGARKVFISLLALIDGYDLHGSVAYPKHHDPDDVPELYKLASNSHGVFVNPALTEPFGLTLLEAAASGLPVVATNDGGPIDIIGRCENGLLVDPLDTAAISDALLSTIEDKKRWKRWSKNGLDGVHKHFSWSGHADSYIQEVKRIQQPQKKNTQVMPAVNRLPTLDRLLVCDIDGTLLGDRLGLNKLVTELKHSDCKIGVGVATGRRLESALDILKEWKLPRPDLLICCVGTEIYYGNQLTMDEGWREQIGYRWEPEKLRAAIKTFKGLKLQPKSEQREHKISYFVDSKKAPCMQDVVHLLRTLDLHAKVVFSHEAFLDILPIRASKGHALRYLGMKWGLEPEKFLVAGDSGNDWEMLHGDTLAIVVGNYSPELKGLRGKPRIYFAEGEYAHGIVEGMMYYDFLGEIVIPNNEGTSE